MNHIFRYKYFIFKINKQYKHQNNTKESSLQEK